MKTIDRTVAPPIEEIDKVYLPKAERFQLSNGIPVWSINAGTQEVIKIEMLFDAGRWQESQTAIASTTAKMLFEGTLTKTAQQISEEIEFYGASVNADAAIDYSHLSLFALTKHLPALLPLLRELIYEASFPEKEFTTYVQNSKQRLMVNLEKVDFLAHKEFNERLYGKDYPNGYTTSAEDYDSLNTSLLLHFYKAHYTRGNCRLILAGKISDECLKLIDEYFGKDLRGGTNGTSKIHSPELTAERKIFVEKKEAVQSGIRIGKFMINKLHPDFAKVRVLNTILGGYFGSRLMQNLREEKGFCYGVHSGIASYVHDANFFITTEVGKEVTEAAIAEIYSEVTRLRNELVPDEELQLVKSYMLGVMLADTDGPFNVAEILRGLIVYGQDESYFISSVEKIKSVSAEEIRELAQQYLDTESMIEVVAGSK